LEHGNDISSTILLYSIVDESIKPVPATVNIPVASLVGPGPGLSKFNPSHAEETLLLYLHSVQL
jgi:hypothetical protein